MQKWFGIGRTTKETELNSSGKMAGNTIAIDRQFKDKDGNKVTDFINLRWLGEKKAEFAKKYISKGVKIGVSGILCVDNYKDKDGNPKQSTYIMVDEVEFCESKSQNQQSTSNSVPNTNQGGSDFISVPNSSDDSLPWD